MVQSDFIDPFQVLGVAQDATESEIRTRYLDLVKKFPPDRDPDQFRKIQAAYEAARDPLLIAQRMTKIPSGEEPAWADVIGKQTQNPPAISLPFLLSLGNREPTEKDGPADE